MALEETEFEQPIEHVIIALGCLLQLRQSNIEYEELLFLKEAVHERIKTYEREIH